MRILPFLALSILALGCGRAAPGPTMNTASSPGVPASQRAEISLEGVDGTAATTRNLYFVFDGSGSMAEPLKRNRGGKKFKTKIEGAKWAVREFIQTVPDDVQLGLFVFDAHGPREVLPLGPNNRTQFLAAVDAVQAHQGTPLGESIVTAADSLVRQYKRQLGYGEFRIIVVTDGASNGQISIQDATHRAESFGFPIYTIGLDIAQGHELRDRSVKYYAADSFEELKQGLQEAAAETETFDPQEFGK